MDSSAVARARGSGLVLVLDRGLRVDHISAFHLRIGFRFTRSPRLANSNGYVSAVRLARRARLDLADYFVAESSTFLSAALFLAGRYRNAARPSAA